MEQRQATRDYQNAGDEAEPQRGLKWSEEMAPRHILVGSRFQRYLVPVETPILLVLWGWSLLEQLRVI